MDTFRVVEMGFSFGVVLNSIWTMWGQADGFEVRFRSSKEDQLLDRMVMSCARAGPPFSLRGQGGAIELIIELLSSCMYLPSHAPLVAFGTERGNWSICTQARTTTALLREVEALAAFPEAEYALRFLRIGDTTFLSAGGGGIGRCSTERREMELGYI